MKASLAHVQVNVSDPAKCLPFWNDLLAYLDYEIIDEGDGHLGATDGATALWLIGTDARFKDAGFHRKRTGLNHLAFQVADRESVDRFRDEFLEPRGIATLYGSPRAFPEYSAGYYAVFFEDPDRIKLEVVYKG